MAEALRDERRAEMDACADRAMEFHIVNPCGMCPRCLLADALAEVDRLHVIEAAAKEWNEARKARLVPETRVAALELYGEACTALAAVLDGEDKG